VYPSLIPKKWATTDINIPKEIANLRIDRSISKRKTFTKVIAKIVRVE
jgi:hypothetical protein